MNFTENRRVPLTITSSASKNSPRKARSLHLDSRIKSDQSITIEGPTKKANCLSTFDSGCWNSTIFPKYHPDRRDDVTLLDDWITERLAELSQKRSDPSFNESSAKCSQDQLRVLDLGFSELCRQVALQCSQRAELMNRLWQASHEIYERLILEMTDTIQSLRSSGIEWQQKCEKFQVQLDAQEYKHSQELKMMEMAAKTSKSEDSVIYREMQEEIYNREKDMALMENILADLSIWFPNFNAYSTSVLRKHLPPIEDCTGLLLRYGQSLGENTQETILPQDLLYQDLKRLEKLDIGFSVLGQESQTFSRLPSRSSQNEALKNDEVVKPHALRSLLFENQVQSVVVEELQAKYTSLLELHESHISQSKVRIDALLIENYKLREQSTAGGSIMVLSRLSPFLQIRGIESLRNEIQELWSSKKTLTIPPSALISVADIQRFLVQFSHSYLCNLSPPSWFLQTTTRKFLGREMPSEGYRSKLSGGFSGIESKIMNCETLMSHYLVITTKSPRLARDTLRRVMWAVWIWSQQTHPDSIGSRFQSIVESLPRHLLEYEKPLIRTLVYAFGFDKIQSASESAKMNETFLKVYIRTFSAMKPFFSCNPKAMGICSSSSTNLFLAASPCIVPVEEIDKILARVFSVSLPEASYKRPVSLSADQPDETTNMPSELMDDKSWWNFLPSRIALSLREDLVLLMNKNAGVSADAFDIIITIWSHLRDYRESLSHVLMELYNYLIGCVGSPTDPMFHTLLFAVLEKNESMISSLHKILSFEILELAASESLNNMSFSELILGSDICLSGLHVLFDASPKMKRDIRKEGERLFSQLHVNNPTEDSETDSLTSDAVIRHAQLLFDSNSPLDQILPEKKLIFVSPEVYFSVTSLKFLSKFIQATEEFTNFSLLPLQAQATHFRLHFLLKKSFRCWVQKIQFRKEKSDSEEEEEDQLTKVPFS